MKCFPMLPDPKLHNVYVFRVPNLVLMDIKVDVNGIDQDSRYRILLMIRNKLGYREACRKLGISMSSMYRYLTRLRKIPNHVTEKCLNYITVEEFNNILSSGEKLRALGFITDEGRIDYKMAVEFIKYIFQDEYLKQLILELVVNEFREELKKLLGIKMQNVEFKWDEDFEYFLTHLKRKRKITSVDTLRYYRNLFRKHLEGKRLTIDLIDEVIKHQNKWLRNVLRHYIQYLYYKRQINPETYGWIMNVVPSRSYRVDIRTYTIDESDVAKTLRFLRKNQRTYYLVYRIMLESGIRYLHALRLIKEFRPDEKVEIPSLGLIPRLVIFDEKGFCRYFLGLTNTSKRCDWVYMSTETLNLLKENSGKTINRSTLTRYIKKHNLILPKYIRKISWRIMIKTVGREISKFLQSRYGELSISEARYENLLTEADEKYPAYLRAIEKYI